MKTYNEIEEKQEIVCDYLFEWENGTWVPDGSFDGIFLCCEKNTEIYIERKPFWSVRSEKRNVLYPCESILQQKRKTLWEWLHKQTENKNQKIKRSKNWKTNLYWLMETAYWTVPFMACRIWQTARACIQMRFTDF